MVDNMRAFLDAERAWLSPPEPDEAEIPCCVCGCDAEYSIAGEDYCERCAKDEFWDTSDDYENCDMCGEEVEFFYKVGNEKYCDACFDEVFKI